MRQDQISFDSLRRTRKCVSCKSYSSLYFDTHFTIFLPESLDTGASTLQNGAQTIRRMADLRLNRARHYQPWPQSVEQNLCYPMSELVVFTFNSDLLSFTFSAISSPINKELTTKKAGVFFSTNLKSGSSHKAVLSLFRVASAPGTVSLTRACWRTARGDVGLTHVLSSEIWDHNLNQAEPNTMLSSQLQESQNFL